MAWDENEGKTSLKQRAYQSIKEKILRCEYEPNQFLNEQQLCAELGNISRTPVRDALSRLEQEGLIRILPKKGTMVAGVSLSDIGRIYEVRLLIEPYTLANYGENLDREALRTFLAQLRGDDPAGRDALYLSRLDDRFHTMLLAALPNRYLRAAYENIQDLNTRIRVLSERGTRARNAARNRETYEEHCAILEAALAEDWPAAAAAMRRHLEMARAAAYQCAVDQGVQGGL